MISDSVKEQIRSIFGSQNVLEEELDRFSYSYDGSFIPLVPAAKPDLIVKAASAEQISSLLKLANEYQIPVIARGMASGRTGGSIPVAGGIVLCMDAMDKILELDEQNLMVTVEPGVRTFDLYNYCAKFGLFYPPDPASWKFSTLGGNLAENAGGPRAVKYGVTRDYVMGLEVVLADGRIVEVGGKAIKNVTGYDMTRLFVGSEGTLGIITKAILRLIPMPEARRTIQVMFTSMEGACDAVTKSIRSGAIPAAAEIMDKTSIQAVAKFRHIEIDDLIEASVIFEVDGDTISLDGQVEKIREAAMSCGAVGFKVAQTQQESDELWSLRRGMGPAVAALAPNKTGEDISVPRSAFPAIVKRLGEISKKYGLQIAIFGHAGDGNLHPSILTDLSVPGEQEKVDQAVREIFMASLELGGTLSGEHGIGITKKPYIQEALGETGVDILRSVKRALDPKGILNPGKIF